jgi:RNA polymerase sigma-70 factor (ECF subfamily)
MTSQEACALGWATPMNGEQPVTTDDDSGLVARFLRGDTAAFDTLFLKYQDYVYHISFGIVGSTEEARDLTQEVFLQVYRSLPRFRQGARFATWLYRITVNRAVDAARGARRWRFLPLAEEPSLAQRAAEPEMEPEWAFERGLERDAVQSVLIRCPLKHRQVLVLRYYRDLSLEEIAEVLECSPTAAKVRLHRARQVFKQYYVAMQEPELPETRTRPEEKADAARTPR